MQKGLGLGSPQIGASWRSVSTAMDLPLYRRVREPDRSRLLRPKQHDRRSPSAGVPRQPEPLDVVATLEQRMDRASKRTGSLAMHDTDLEDAAAPALVEVGGDEILDLARVEPVEVQDPIDGKFDDFRQRVVLVHAHQDRPSE